MSQLVLATPIACGLMLPALAPVKRGTPASNYPVPAVAYGPLCGCPGTPFNSSLSH